MSHRAEDLCAIVSSTESAACPSVGRRAREEAIPRCALSHCLCCPLPCMPFGMLLLVLLPPSCARSVNAGHGAGVADSPDRETIWNSQAFARAPKELRGSQEWSGMGDGFLSLELQSNRGLGRRRSGRCAIAAIADCAIKNGFPPSSICCRPAESA